jgi:hypothetical protein
MTKFDILNMKAGRDLDSLVWLNIFGQPCDKNKITYNDGIPIKHYSIDIAAAFDVVEHMVSLGYHYTLNYIHDNRYPEPVRHACFSKLKSNYLGNPLYAVQNDFDHYHAHSESVSESICKAALLAFYQIQ